MMTVRVGAGADLSVPQPHCENVETLISVDVRPSVWIVQQESDKEMKSYAEQARQAGSRVPQIIPNWVKPANVKRIQKLACLPMVDQMIMDGFSAGDIAIAIQGQGEYADHSTVYVSTLVDHYRATVPRSAVVRRMVTNLMKHRKRDGLTTAVQALERVDDVYQRLKAKMDLIDQQQAQFGQPYEGSEKTFHCVLEVLKVQMEAQNKLGLFRIDTDDRESKTEGIDWDAIYSQHGMNKVMHDPASRYRVVRFVEALNNMYGDRTPEEQARALEIAAKSFKQEFGVGKDMTIEAVEERADSVLEEPQLDRPRVVASEEPVGRQRFERRPPTQSPTQSLTQSLTQSPAQAAPIENPPYCVAREQFDPNAPVVVPFIVDGERARKREPG